MSDNLLLQMNKKVELLKNFIIKLISFEESSLKFKSGTDTVREKMIISFTVSIANHLLAVKDLLFYRTFSELGEIIYVPAENYHALSISGISRSMLESSAILYWILQGDENVVSFKTAEYYRYIQFAHAVNIMNSKTSDGQPTPLNAEQEESITRGNDFWKKNSHQKNLKDRTPMDVRDDVYSAIDSKLNNIDSKINLTALVANFLAQDFAALEIKTDHFRQMYRFLSDLSHSNPSAIASMFSIEKVNDNEVTIIFNNGDPEILFHALSTAVNCYCYVLEIFFRCFNKEAEILTLAEIMAGYGRESAVI